jgi:signal transduction histidine kinase
MHRFHRLRPLRHIPLRLRLLALVLAGAVAIDMLSLVGRSAALLVSGIALLCWLLLLAGERAEAALQPDSSELTLGSAFVEQLGYDLRSQLNVILGMADMLLEQMAGLLTVQQGAALATILVTGRDVLHQFNLLLKLAHLEAGSLPHTPKVFSLAAACQSSLQALEEKTQLAQVRMTFEPPPELAMIRADEEHIEQIITEVLRNAVNSVPPGSSVRLELVRDADANLVRLTTRDAGTPLLQVDSTSLQAGSLREFRRISQQAARATPGLLLAARLAAVHGGSLRVWRSNGENLLRVVLPLAESPVQE